MIVEMLDGTVIEDAAIVAASPGSSGLAFRIQGMCTDDGHHGVYVDQWIEQDTIRTIHFTDQ